MCCIDINPLYFCKYVNCKNIDNLDYQRGIVQTTFIDLITEKEVSYLMNFYLDECYNTGNNWLYQNQLFFTYGGWTISPKKVSDAELIIQSFREHHQGELKSKSFTSHKGISEVITLSEKLINECGAKPYFMCLEKYFMIACKVVEVFFDHKTNKAVNDYLTFPNEYEYYRIIFKQNHLGIDYDSIKSYLPPIGITKLGLADVIQYDESFCKDIAEILNGKKADNNSIVSIIKRLKRIFLNAGFNTIASIFDIDNFTLDDICDELNGESFLYKTKHVSKFILVQPCLYEMICALNETHTNLSLVVDTLGAQNFQFSEMSSMLKIPIKIINESELNAMIMASDLLVGQIARLVQSITLESKDIVDKDLKLLKYCFSPSETPFQNGSSYWFCKFSYNTWKILKDALNLDVKIFDYRDVLKEQFPIFLKAK